VRLSPNATIFGKLFKGDAEAEGGGGATFEALSLQAATTNIAKMIR
jgi:hypothetical protein